MMVLVRDSKTDKAILGHIVLDDALICYTCENREKAIPVGLYSLQNSKSPKFKRELPLLYNATVPAKRGIRIHSGNSWKDSSGCVLVGMSRNCVAGTISESKNAETMITMLCRNVCQLAIVDNT
jgi:hypothetical protein